MHVVNANICLLTAQEHLKERFGGTIHLEDTFMSEFFKRDGDKKIKCNIFFSINDKRHSWERRVHLYLSHDMVSNCPSMMVSF